MSIDQSVLDKFEAVVESQQQAYRGYEGSRAILLITPSWTN